MFSHLNIFFRFGKRNGNMGLQYMLDESISPYPLQSALTANEKLQQKIIYPYRNY